MCVLCFCFSLQEEDFTGFGTTTLHPQKVPSSPPQPSSLSLGKPPPAPDLSPGAKPLIGKIVPRGSKQAVIGKIVQRSPTRVQGVIESPEKGTAKPRIAIKLPLQQIVACPGVKPAGEQATGTHTSTTLGDSIRTGDMVDSPSAARKDNMQHQTVKGSVSTSSTKQGKLVCCMAVVKGKDKVSRVKEPGEVAEDSETEQAQPQRSVKSTRGSQRGNNTGVGDTSQDAALSLKAISKQQKGRVSKDMGASPEAGAKTGQEAAMPLDVKAGESPTKRTPYKRRRKPTFGVKRKVGPKVGPKIVRRRRVRHVFYTYIPEPIRAIPNQEGEGLDLQGQNAVKSEGEPCSSSGQVQQGSTNSSTHLVSGRSSRVIKAPKRFLDDDMIVLPKGSPSQKYKSQGKERVSRRVSCYVTDSDGGLFESDLKSICSDDRPTAPKPSPGSSHLDVYQKLKKLTLKLAEKKKGQSNAQVEEEMSYSPNLTSPARRKRRSKITMEEMDSPGVVRKLAVLVNTSAATSKEVGLDDVEIKSKDLSLTFHLLSIHFCVCALVQCRYFLFHATTVIAERLYHSCSGLGSIQKMSWHYESLTDFILPMSLLGKCIECKMLCPF